MWEHISLPVLVALTMGRGGLLRSKPALLVESLRDIGKGLCLLRFLLPPIDSRLLYGSWVEQSVGESPPEPLFPWAG